MSAMEQMLANMLKKALPPEVMELLTPDKIQEFGNNLSAFVNDTRNTQKAILDKVEQIFESQERQRASLEALLGKPENGSRKPNSRNSAGANGDAS